MPKWLRYLLLPLIIAGAWLGFLFLISKKPHGDETEALVMVWITAFILIFALFPGILDKIKKIKFKDFEIELRETVSKSTIENYIPVSSNEDKYVFTTKGKLGNLVNVLRRTRQEPSRPILLVVNLKGPSSISIPMLFLYMFFLDLFSPSVSVLFISSKQKLYKLSEITEDLILGVTSGNRVMRSFIDRFPALIPSNWESGQPNDFLVQDFSIPAESQLHFIYDNIKRKFEDLQTKEYLKQQNLYSWLGGELNMKSIKASLQSADIKTILDAIQAGDEYILAYEKRWLKSVISICSLTKSISKKILIRLESTK